MESHNTQARNLPPWAVNCRGRAGAGGQALWEGALVHQRTKAFEKSQNPLGQNLKMSGRAHLIASDDWHTAVFNIS